MDWCEVWNQTDAGTGIAEDNCSNLYNVDGERSYEQCRAAAGTTVNSHVNKQWVDMRKDAGKAKTEISKLLVSRLRKTRVLRTLSDSQQA